MDPQTMPPELVQMLVSLLTQKTGSGVEPATQSGDQTGALGLPANQAQMINSLNSNGASPSDGLTPPASDAGLTGSFPPGTAQVPGFGQSITGLPPSLGGQTGPGTNKPNQ